MGVTPGGVKINLTIATFSYIILIVKIFAIQNICKTKHMLRSEADERKISRD